MNPSRLQYSEIKFLLFFLLLLLPLSVTRAQEPVAFITPLTYTAYLGQPAVSFNCSVANASSVAWSVDGDIRLKDWLETREIETVTGENPLESSLIISSAVVNNNTRIVCLARHFVGFDYEESVEVTFRVQGTLGKCPNLQITPFGTYHQHLKWDAPATLNITEVEPDISSYIVCSNISTECTTINVTEAGGDSQDLRQYIFPNLRAYINFTVTAVNILGDGERTSIVYEPCEHTEGAPHLSTVVTFDSLNTPSLAVEVMSHKGCYNVYKIQELEKGGSGILGLYEPEVIESGWIFPSIDVSGDGKLTLNVTTNFTLSTNSFYNATIITAMEARRIRFSTYDVQDVELRAVSENISIQCVFASGSQARGCHVEIGDSFIEINITRNNDSQSHTAEETATGLSPGSYEVLVFDWERDNSLSSTPSYVGHVNVAEVDQYQSPTTAPPDTKGTGANQLHPTSLTVAHIAAIAGAGAGLLLLLVLVIIMVLAIRFTCRKRQYTVAEKRHKELKEVDVKEWEKSTEENDYKDRIYDLPVQPKKQPRFKRLDSTVPLLDSNPLYDLPSPLPTPTCTTFTARDSSETSSQPQSPDGVHVYDTADHSLHAANIRQSGANSPSQASSSSTSEVQPTVTSPHLYTKPSKKKKPARKPTTTTTDSPSVTDGDSGRETMSPDQQLTGDENSDLTPPLPPRNYVNVDVDTTPPSGSDEKIAGTGEEPQERQSSSCVLLLEAQTGNTSDNLPCQNGAAQDYFHLQHMYPPNVSIISVDSDLYSELQDPPPVMGVMDNSTGHIYQVLNQLSVARDDSEYTIPQDSTSNIPGQSGQKSPETSDMKVGVGPPLDMLDQEVQV